MADECPMANKKFLHKSISRTNPLFVAMNVLNHQQNLQRTDISSVHYLFC